MSFVNVSLRSNCTFVGLKRKEKEERFRTQVVNTTLYTPHT